MSIFKGTLKPFVAAQLKAREKVIGQVEGNVAGVGPRDSTFLRYTTGKNGWVRMISMVNYDSQAFSKNTGRYESDGRYSGNQLTRKYILEGGTLYEGSNGFYLRRGVNQKDGIYGSNIDKIAFDPKSNKIDRTYGIRPMPGITSVSIQNKSAYGSLREATVNFYAWDKHQLEELEVLFMRPGYSVFVDWGWSQYLDHGVAKQNINSYPDNIRIENLLAPIPNSFLDPIKEDTVYNFIDSQIEKYNGNYDAMIGYVKNFSWQMMSNGGWQCSTTIISRGEALEEIKASNNPRTIIGSKTPPTPPAAQLNGTEEPPEPPLSFFEKLFLTIKGALNTSEFGISSAAGNSGTSGISGTAGTSGTSGTTTVNATVTSTPNGTSGTSGTSGVFGNIQPEFYAQGANAQAALARVKEEFEFIKTALKEDTAKYKIYAANDDGSKAGVYHYNGYPINVFPGGVLPAEGTTDGSGIEYISMDIFIAILQRFLIPRDENTKEPLLYLVVPGRTPSLISEDSVSIDPTTCLVRNQYAKFITGLDTGFEPVLYNNLTWDGTKLTPGTTIQIGTYPFDSFVKNKKVKAPDPQDKKKTIEIDQTVVNIGEIGNIYISIGKIIQTYRNLAGSDGVNVIDLLINILEDISFSLGGINDFKLYTERNIVQIIDAKYLEVGEPASSKFKMDLVGLKSICRDVKINSKIFPEQSSMIAIGAAAGGNSSANLGDIYNSTQAMFNKGLKDRVIRDMTFDEGNKEVPSMITGENLYYFQIYQNISALEKYIKTKVLGIDSTGQRGFNSITTPTDEEITNAGSMLKTLHYQINGKDIDFKALIPFELEITLDGIGGFVIGQIFTIDKSILPRDYYNKNLGFVITGVSHMLQNNDWVTTLKTQICLLDNDGYEVSDVDKAKLKKAIETLKAQNQSRAYVFYAMVDYIIYLLVRIMTDDGANKLKAPFEAGTKAVINGPGMDTSYFSPSNTQKALYRISDDTTKNDGLAGGLGFTGENYGGGLKKYMEAWWTQNKTNTSLPNFPTSSFDEFTQIVLPDGTTVPGDAIGRFIISFDKYLLNTTNLTKNLTIKDGFVKENDFFLYKFFGTDPKAFFENGGNGVPAFVTKKKIQTGFRVEGKDARQVPVYEDQDVVNLKEVYAYLLGQVQNYINSIGQFGFIIQGNAAPITSLEVDINGEGYYKLDV